MSLVSSTVCLQPCLQHRILGSTEFPTACEAMISLLRSVQVSQCCMRMLVSSVAASCFAIFAIFVMCVCDLCTCQCLACAAPEFEYVCILQQSKLRVMLVFCLRNLLLSSEHILSFYICDCRAFDARLLRGQRVVHVFFSIRFLQNRFSELFVCEILHCWQPELATRVGNQSFTVPFFCTYVQWKSR